MEQYTFPLAVVMERLVLHNPWASHQWQAASVMPDVFGSDPSERVLMAGDQSTRLLFPGLALRLFRDETENYYLNVSAAAPRVFVMWRMRDSRLSATAPVARPEHATVSYGEAARWMDSNETVDGVPMPAQVFAWVGEYVERYYRPEPKKIRRRT